MRVAPACAMQLPLLSLCSRGALYWSRANQSRSGDWTGAPDRPVELFLSSFQDPKPYWCLAPSSQRVAHREQPKSAKICAKYVHCHVAPRARSAPLIAIVEGDKGLPVDSRAKVNCTN